MSSNKLAFIRYTTLDRCFKSSAFYDIEKLLLEVNREISAYHPTASGIKKRTLYLDIKYLVERYNVVFDNKYKNKRPAIYRYEDPSFSIFINEKLNEHDKANLKEALHVLSMFSGSERFKMLDETVARLKQELDLDLDGTKKIIEFNDYQSLNEITSTSGILRDLYDYISNKQVVQIKYKSYHENAIETYYELSPHFLKQSFNDRWYVFGHTLDSDRIMDTYALERIISIKPILDNNNYIKSSIDFNEYFDDIVGVTHNKDDSVKEIILGVQKEYFKYFHSKPPHWSYMPNKNLEYEKVVNGKREQWIKVHLKLKSNLEFQSILLSYGQRIEVIKPNELKMTIINRLRQALNNYRV